MREKASRPEERLRRSNIAIANHKSKKIGMYGKTHSNLTRERMKAAWNKRKLEGRTNKSGHIMSDETKLKIGNSIRKKHQEKHSK
jgi:hypothetical protein